MQVSIPGVDARVIATAKTSVSATSTSVFRRTVKSGVRIKEQPAASVLGLAAVVFRYQYLLSHSSHSPKRAMASGSPDSHEAILSAHPALST